MFSKPAISKGLYPSRRAKQDHFGIETCKFGHSQNGGQRFLETVLAAGVFGFLILIATRLFRKNLHQQQNQQHKGIWQYHAQRGGTFLCVKSIHEGTEGLFDPHPYMPV
jgi:hypothetical protein